MNRYFQNLSKMEFVITYACTGRCKHCSEGDHSSQGQYIDGNAASDLVRSVASHYPIQTVMTFGGEPLLRPEAVYKIHAAAREMNVAKRQVITNGFFSTDISRMRLVADSLADCGVNDLLLSVDAFHQETIPLDIVKTFAAEAVKRKIPLRLQPAWLVSAQDNNAYNCRTREILAQFTDMKIPVSEGNIVFPEGNALKYLGGYFSKDRPENPYVEDPRDMRCLSFDPNGDVLNGNAFKRDILEIMREYEPNI